MSDISLLKELDDYQYNAAITFKNAVVSAGAGSGKTKVLAARYVYLIVEKGYKVDEILTLTFTEKAVSEMYSRIYKSLESTNHPNAKKAINDFYKAKIYTFDSYSASIARIASRNFGIVPTFSIAIDNCCEIISKKALPFVLKYRNRKSLKYLISKHDIQKITDEIFVKIIEKYSCITKPLDFKSMLEIQKNECIIQWKKSIKEINSALNNLQGLMVDYSEKNDAMINSLELFFTENEAIEVPDEKVVQNYFEKKTQNVLNYISDYLNHIKVITLIKKSRKKNLKELCDILGNITEYYSKIRDLANFIFFYDIQEDLFDLLRIFQDDCNHEKRLKGTLSFKDIAQLALDTLIEYPEIRNVEKRATKAIMIDEFQDDNNLQKDMLFLIAENEERTEKTIPSVSELCSSKLFFVGDEKQSIYKFRGADVSVFRKLKNEFSYNNGAVLNLITNYRSHPGLITSFNYFFGGYQYPTCVKEFEKTLERNPCSIFLQEQKNEPLPVYEAEYEWVKPHLTAFEEESKLLENTISICILPFDKSEESVSEEQSSNEDNLDCIENEAIFISQKISKMVNDGYLIREKKNGKIVYRKCRYEDFAILFRTKKNQHYLERFLKNENIPYVTIDLKSFGQDAPVNDTFNLLRLLVYQNDTHSYLAVLKSPYVGLSTEAALLCLSEYQLDEDENKRFFDKKISVLLDGSDKDNFIQFADFYDFLCEYVKSASLTSLITKIWYDSGYRYETLWNDKVQMYNELYDYLFEIARQTENLNKTLPEFIDIIEEIMEGKSDVVKKMDIPSEKETGVQLMTIHSSKGLEFPIVFIFSAGSEIKTPRTNLVNYNKWGFSINFSTHEKLEKHSAECFFCKLAKEEEYCMEIAEQRRLLYVAMTRAETALFITGCANITKSDRKNLKDEYSLEDVIALKCSEKSFLGMIFTVLKCFYDANPACKPFFNLEKIPSFTRDEINKIDREYSIEKSINKAKKLIENCDVIYQQILEPYVISPSVLNENASFKEVFDSTDLYPELEECLENSLNEYDLQENFFENKGKKNKNRMSRADFGTIVHALIESQIKKVNPQFKNSILSFFEENPSKKKIIMKAASDMKDKFFMSEKGSELLSAKWVKSEVSFKRKKIDETQRKGYVIISGTVDCIYEADDGIVLIDFKTDRKENPEFHRNQINEYRIAFEKIYKKSVSCYIHYLRSGNQIKLF